MDLNKILNLQSNIIIIKIVKKYILNLINKKNIFLLNKIKQTDGDLNQCLQIIKPKNNKLLINQFILKLNGYLPNETLFNIWVIAQLGENFNIQNNILSYLNRVKNIPSVLKQILPELNQELQVCQEQIIKILNNNIQFLNQFQYTNPFLLEETKSFLLSNSQLTNNQIENISIYVIFGEKWSPFMDYFRSIEQTFNIIDWCELINHIYLNPAEYSQFYKKYESVIKIFEKNPLLLKTPYITINLFNETKQILRKNPNQQDLLERGYNFKDFFDDVFVFNVFRGNHYPFIAIWTIPNMFSQVPELENIFLKFPELTGAFMGNPLPNSDEYNLFRADVLYKAINENPNFSQTPFYQMIMNLNKNINKPNVSTKKSFEFILVDNVNEIFLEFETKYNLGRGYLTNVFNKFVKEPYDDLYNPKNPIIDLVDLIEMQGKDYKLIEKVELQKIINFFYSRDIITFFIPFLRNLNLTVSPNPLEKSMGNKPYIIQKQHILEIISLGNQFQQTSNLQSINELLKIINYYQKEVIPNLDFTTQMEKIMSCKPFWFWSPQERKFRMNNTIAILNQLDSQPCSEDFILKMSSGGFMKPSNQSGGKMSYGMSSFSPSFEKNYSGKTQSVNRISSYCENLVSEIISKVNSVCNNLGNEEMLNPDIIPQENYRYLFGNSHNVNPFMNCLNFRTKVFNDRGVNTFFYQYNTLVNKIYDQSVMYNKNNLFPAQFIFDNKSFVNQYLQNSMEFINENMIFLGFLKIDFIINSSKLLKKRKVPYYHPIYLNVAHLKVIEKEPIFKEIRRNQVFTILDFQGIEIQKGNVSKTWMTTFLEFNEFTKMNFSLPQEKILLDNDSWFSPQLPNLILMSRRISNPDSLSPFIKKTNPIIETLINQKQIPNLEKVEFYTSIDNASHRKRLCSTNTIFNNEILNSRKDYILNNFQTYQEYLRIVVPEKLKTQYQHQYKNKMSLSNDSQGFSLSNDSQGFSLAKTHFDLIGFFINGTVNENLNRNLSVYINFLNQSFKEESRKKLLTELTKQDEKPILNQKQQYSKKPINQIPVLQMPTFDFQSNIRVVPQVYS